MATSVVQERHLWLNLADTKDAERTRLLDAPLSQVGMFGGAVEDFSQQFSTAQKQTEAIEHIQPRRSAAATTQPSAQTPPSARHRGRPPAAPLPSRRSGVPEMGCSVMKLSVSQEEMSVVRMTPLVHFLGAWLELPRLSRWVIRTIRFGYALQFARSPPRFRGVRSTMVGGNALVMRAEIATLLAKGEIETVPPAEVRSGFYSPYFIVPKKTGGLRPILDLRILNRTLHRLPFKMLTAKRIFECIRPQDWFAAIDLKDAYFHVSILPRHRPFLRFAFEGQAYQYTVLPFGLALSPRVFTKIVEAALVPLREQGVRILNYLDDWLILAHSREQVCEHRDLVLRHLACLGFRVNREKSKLCPVQRISFLGMEIDSVAIGSWGIWHPQPRQRCSDCFI
ncbi:gag-pol fusion protein [Pimephales promelas]|nr:gag-pol fusion protein [Pimephales promelas]